MRRMLGVAVVVLVSGCGGPPPAYESNFAGVWDGTLNETDVASGTALGGFETELLIEATGLNLLELNNFCIDGVGPTVTVTSATQFSGSIPVTCRPEGDEDCASIVATYTSVSGTLNGGTLSVTTNVTFSGCGQTEALRFDFSGTRVPGT